MDSFEFNYLDPYRNVKKYSRLRLYFYSRGFDRFKIGLNSMKTRVEAFSYTAIKIRIFPGKLTFLGRRGEENRERRSSHTNRE